VISAYKIIILRQSAICNGCLLRQVISASVASISFGKEPVCMVKVQCKEVKTQQVDL